MANAFLSTVMLFAFSSSIAAQSSEDFRGEEKGFTFYHTLQGSSNTLGQVIKLDPSVGYKFNKYFGVDMGMPFYFVRSATTSSITGAGSKNGIGNAYVDLQLTLNNPALNFASTLTGTAPTGDTARGFSTGRVTLDWNNHFDRTISRMTPFANVGVANTISDTHFFTRPFSSLGLVGHFDGGANYAISHLLSVGVDVYKILPSGQQKIFSKVIKRQSGGLDMQGSGSGQSRHKRVFETTSATVGSADIASDHGYSVWFNVTPAPYLDFQVGYNRSIPYALNTVSFGAGVNLGMLAKKVGH